MKLSLNLLKTPATLPIRRWLVLAWLSYALLPAIPILLVYGLLSLVLGQDASKNGAVVGVAIASGVGIEASVLIGVGLFLGRAVLRPLAALGKASGQVASGSLDFELPSSRVREVAEVAAGFTAMRDGLREALVRQAELEQERRFFVAAIAHDLRTPLFSLRGYLEGLERGVASTPEKQEHYLAVCRTKADELERLVADLFAYTQVERLEQVAHRQPLDLGALLRQTVEGIQPQAEAKGVTLALEGPQTPCTLEGDAHLLARAVTNLLDNALRYTPAGGTIRVRWQADPTDAERWHFTVADSGPGIEPRDLPHLFDPLYRAETSRSRETGGAGLGLAIARRILLAHGGDLTAANAPGGGAVFTATLARSASMSARTA